MSFPLPLSKLYIWNRLKISIYVTAFGIPSQTDGQFSHVLISLLFLSNGFGQRRCSVYQAYMCIQAFTTCAAASKLSFQIPSARADVWDSSLESQEIILTVHVAFPVSPPLKPTKWQHQTWCFPSASVSSKLTNTRCLFSHLPSSEVYK